MKYILSLSLLLILFVGCRHSDNVAPNKATEALYQRFHGRYKIVSSTADEAVDLNMDGQSSTDLKNELVNLPNSELELRIKNSGSSYLFYEFWQEPCFGNPSGGDLPPVYNPSLIINYCNQGVGRTFDFSADLKSIYLGPESPTTDTMRYTRPSSVVIKDGDMIEIIKIKRFYTFSGWKYVRVVTLYKRYTMIT